jgi:hypothetical protein
LAHLGSVTDLAGYAGALDAAIRAYAGHHDDVRFSGFFGTEFGNITFPGERADAERFLAAYLQYQRDDQHIRALVRQGDRIEAIVFCNSYQAGNSNAHFTAFDQALSPDITLNRTAFAIAIRAGQGDLIWSSGAPPLVAVVVLAGLTLLGVWRRLAEYS